jgi:glycosyltransferase involved in cell wall biosynthesis
MRLRVLLSAYYCSPYRGGESAVGWHVAAGLARYHDITVICGDLARDSPTLWDIDRLRREGGMPPGLEIIHLPARDITRRIHDLHCLPGLWFLYYEAYRRWQGQILMEVRRLHAERPFDVIHHVNIVGFREPGYLWQMGVPFFWGPVSGAPMVPQAFLRDFGGKERLRWFTRNLANRLQIHRGGRPAEAARAAAKVWAVSPEDHEMLSGWGVTAEPMLEGGTGSNANIGRIRKLNDGEPLRICWSGLFQGIKELPILLRAVSGLKPGSFVLEILGDGPEARRWKALAGSLGLDSQIHWHGMIPRENALGIMDRCHLLVHTSIKEATSTVLMEALERGMPVLCHDACGMGTAITGESGIKIPLRDPEASVRGFRDALSRILSSPGLLETLSQGAAKRARDLSWDEKIRRISGAYLAAVPASLPI